MTTKEKTIKQMSSFKTIIAKCTCKHEYQDSIYGKGNRLWNHAPAKGAKPRRYRCTVCLSEKEF